MVKLGKEFEQLAAKISKELLPDAEVKWNDHIYGHNSEKNRQIDVSIRAKLDEHEILTIIQCKDWSKPADITEVDEFASVIRDVMATKGILICKSGFTGPAIPYAKNLGILLLNLHDAQSRDWNLDVKIPVLWREYNAEIDTHTPFYSPDTRQVVFVKNKDDISSKGIPRYSPDNGKNYLDFNSTFKRWWDEGKLPKVIGKKFTFPIKQEFSILTLHHGKEDWLPVLNPYFHFEIKLKRTLLGYFKPSECRGIVDYHNDEAFHVSHLPSFDQLPKKPEEDWAEIPDVSKTPLDIKGTILSVKAMLNFESFSNSEVSLNGKPIE